MVLFCYLPEGIYCVPKTDMYLLPLNQKRKKMNQKEWNLYRTVCLCSEGLLHLRSSYLRPYPLWLRRSLCQISYPPSCLLSWLWPGQIVHFSTYPYSPFRFFMLLVSTFWSGLRLNLWSSPLCVWVHIFVLHVCACVLTCVLHMSVYVFVLHVNTVCICWWGHA